MNIYDLLATGLISIMSVMLIFGKKTEDKKIQENQSSNAEQTNAEQTLNSESLLLSENVSIDENNSSENIKKIINKTFKDN